MNKKILLRLVFLLLGLWCVLLLILYFSGNSHKEHILRLLQRHLADNLTTEIHIQKKGIHFSIFRNFPNVGLQLNNILIKSSPKANLDDFPLGAKDTLLFADEISLLFNLKSLITKKYELKKIVISGGKLNILTDKSGNGNYKVLKPTHKSAGDSVSIQLKSIILSNTDIYYLDAKRRLHCTAFTPTSEFSGEFARENFSIQAKAQMRNLFLTLEGKNHLEGILANLSLDIRKSESDYYFEKGHVTVPGASISIEGNYNESTRNYNFIAESISTSVAKISYPDLNEFLAKNKIEIEKGSLDSKTVISGIAGEKGSSVTTTFQLQKGVLKNKQRKVQLNNISLRGRYIHNPSGIQSVFFDTLSLDSDKSEISGIISLKNLDNPLIEGRIGGVLDLKKLMLFETISRRMDLNGIIRGTLVMKGKVSKEPDSWRASVMSAFRGGELTIEEGYVRPLMNPLPEAHVNGIIRFKGASDIWLENVSLKTGNSDLLINGSVLNLPLFSGDRSIFPVYRCTVSSEEFHVGDFFMENNQGNKDIASKVLLPDSMIVMAQLKVDKFVFGKFSATQAEGSIHYKPKTLTVSNFSMKSQKGEIYSEIKLSQQNQRLKLKSRTNFQKVDIGDMFYAFNNFGQQVIGAENLDGRLTGMADVEADWDFYLKPFPEDLTLQSEFLILDGELINYPPMLGLSKFIEVEELSHIIFDKLETNIRIHNREVFIAETNINSSAISLVASGRHDFDNRYNYNMQVHLSDILWKKAKNRKPENTEFGYIVDDGLGKTTIPLIIIGKDKEFEVTYDRKKSSSDFRYKVKEEKKELKRLFEPENKEVQVEKGQDIRIEWEDDETGSAQNNPDEDIGIEEEVEDQEFLIEWEDE